MAYKSNAVGVPVVGVGKPDLTAALPTSTFGALTTVTAAAKTPVAGSFVKNDGCKLLSGTYTVSISLIGYDNANTGYTVTPCPAFSSAVTPTSGQGILVRLPQADFLTGMAEAFACAVWVQKGSANAQLARFAYLNPQHDFSCLVMYEPLATVPFIDPVLLQATTANTSTYLGSRAPYAITFPSYTPTTGGVKLSHKTTKVNFKPDDTVDYDRVTARATTLKFSVMSNQPAIVANAIGGNTWQYVDTDSTTVTEVESDLYAVSINDAGNLPISVIYPADNQGNVTYGLHFGNLTSNCADFDEDYMKTEPFKMDFDLSNASLDSFLDGLHTGVRFTKV